MSAVSASERQLQAELTGKHANDVAAARYPVNFILQYQYLTYGSSRSKEDVVEKVVSEMTAAINGLKNKYYHILNCAGSFSLESTSYQPARLQLTESINYLAICRQIRSLVSRYTITLVKLRRIMAVPCIP